MSIRCTLPSLKLRFLTRVFVHVQKLALCDMHVCVFACAYACVQLFIILGHEG